MALLPTRGPSRGGRPTCGRRAAGACVSARPTRTRRRGRDPPGVPGAAMVNRHPTIIGSPAPPGAGDRRGWGPPRAAAPPVGSARAAHHRRDLPLAADAPARGRGPEPSPRTRRHPCRLPPRAGPPPEHPVARRPPRVQLRFGGRGLRRPRRPGRNLGLRLRDRPDRRVGGTRRRAGDRGRPGLPPGQRRAHLARARAGARRRDLGVCLRDRSVHGARDRQGRAPGGLERRAARAPRGHPRRRRPDPGAGEQVLRRPHRDDDHPAARPGAAQPRGHGRGRGDGPLRDDGHPRPAGRSRLGVPGLRRGGTGRPNSPRYPTCSPRSSPHRPSRRAATTWWSTRRTCG